MATPIATLKNYFKTGMFPTQAQFWAWLDSYRHKDDKVPVADIAGLNELFQPINTFINQSGKIPFGQFQIFKATSNTSALLEVNDVAVGFLADGTFIPFGKYLGNDIQDINNWETSPMWQPE